MPSAIELDGVTKSYGQHRAIAGIDLSVESGEIMGFLGANGAGKTTTLRCLVGLLRPDGGHIRVLDLDPHLDRQQLHRVIGYLPGELRLYENLTGRQHLELLADLQQSPSPRQNELCEQLGLTAADLARPIRNYSRGMKQKIGLVQAFQHQPKAAFLDEPTEGLDPLVQQAFFDLLKTESERGCTVLLSSHIMSEVQRACQRAAIIRDGKILTVDSVDNLRNTQTRRVQVTFADNVDHNSVSLPVEWSPQWQQQQLTVTVAADKLVDALRRFLELDVVDVVAEEPSLDEAVLEYYSGDKA